MLNETLVGLQTVRVDVGPRIVAAWAELPSGGATDPALLASPALESVVCGFAEPGTTARLFIRVPDAPYGSATSTESSFLADLVASVPSGCEFFRVERECGGNFSMPRWWPHAGPSLTVHQVDADVWPPELLPSWLDVARMLLLGHVLMDSCFGERDLAADAETPTRLSPLPVVAHLCGEAETSRLLCLEPIGTRSCPRWRVRLAVSVEPESAGAAALAASADAVARFQAGELDTGLAGRIRGFVEDHRPDEAFVAQVVLANVVGSSALAEHLLLADAEGAVGPYAAVGTSWSCIELAEPPAFLACLQRS